MVEKGVSVSDEKPISHEADRMAVMEDVVETSSLDQHPINIPSLASDLINTFEQKTALMAREKIELEKPEKTPS
jgi:hypothetical protein